MARWSQGVAITAPCLPVSCCLPSRNETQ